MCDYISFNEDDEEEEEDELVKTFSNDFDDEAKITDKAEGHEDEEMDYTTSQLYDDMDIWLNEPVQADDETIQKEGTDAELTNLQQGNDNSKISQVIKDAHVTLSTVAKKTKVPITSSSHLSNLQANSFTHYNTYISIIIESSPIYSTIIPQSIPSFTPLPPQLTPTSPPTTKATNSPSTLPDFASVFQSNNRVTALEKEVAELKKDNPLKTQVTAIVYEHLDIRLGAIRDAFMNFLSASTTARIIEQVKNQLPQILPEEVSKFSPLIVQRMVTESLDYVVLAKEIGKVLDIDKTLLSTYDKVYSLKRSQKYKDKDKDPSAGSDWRLKKRKTSKDVEPTKEEPEFEVAGSNMPQDQEENPSNNDKEPKGKVASKCDWFTKPKRPQEPTDPD
uniref:Uncharacterized protein n=1 Tax=Tanacetum cinerariifolium TaxID=118510 RepID=A0A6L2KZS2_TANCI|nr:hypothetical protein [Tanacetum cinerariifolium]